MPSPLHVGQSVAGVAPEPLGATPAFEASVSTVSPIIAFLPVAWQSGHLRFPIMILPVPSHVSQSARSAAFAASICFTAASTSVTTSVDSSSTPFSMRIGNPFAPLPTPSTRVGSNSESSVIVILGLVMFSSLSLRLPPGRADDAWHGLVD